MKLKRIIAIGIGTVLVLGGVSIVVAWTVFRSYVPKDKMLVLTRKMGAPLPPGQQIAEPGQKGIQRATLGPGRYFLNPFIWETEVLPLVEVPAGDPETWTLKPNIMDLPPGEPAFDGKLPMVAVLTNRVGKPWEGEGASEVVPEGYQGIQREVLTPGKYRLNPYVYDWEFKPAVVVPVGYVGVVKSQLGDMPGVKTVRETIIGPDGEPREGEPQTILQLAEEGQRGILRKVLPPGIYYKNPYVEKVRLVPIGYNQISQLKTDTADINFPSKDGFTIELEVVVVWGRHPEHAPEMVNRLGDLEKITRIILGQIRSICRNIGSQYESTDFIRGQRREEYQTAVTETLRTVARQKNVEILIALIQNIEVKAGMLAGGEAPDLKKTIQRRYIAEEEKLTKEAQRDAAQVKADLEAAQAAIEVAREEITSDTRKKVAEIMATGEKQAQQIDAQRELEVAQIERQIAELDAKKTRVLGRAEAEVTELKRQAKADGERMMVQAFGSGAAYNLYTFASNFQPESIRLIFAGEGTFWTDLNRLQDVASLELLRNAQSRANDTGEQ